MGVLENINIHDGAGNSLTSTSGALDVNLKTSAAAVTVAQPTGSNLHTVVDSGTITSITDPVTVAQPTAADLNATVRLQDGSGNPVTSTGGTLDSNLKTIGGSAVVTGTGASGAGVPRVTVANDSKVEIWDGTNSAKFNSTGEQVIDITRFGGSAVQLGQSNMAHSIPVAFASDQELAVSGVYNNQTGAVTSGTVPTAQDGTLTLVNDVFTWSTLVLNFVPAAYNQSGYPLGLGGTFQVEGSIDGTTWTALTGTLLSDAPEQITQYTTTGFTQCSCRYNLAGFPSVRLHTTAAFTGTINVQQALTTAQGDEVGFTTARIVDASGNSVDVGAGAQYTEGQNPQAAYYQGGQVALASFPESGQTANPAEAVYLLPKRSQIGNTLVIAVVLQGTGLTAANLAPMWLQDTAGSVYTLSQIYDSTVTESGQAIALYVKTITALDNQGQLGLMLGYAATIDSGGNTVTSITGVNILAHEYSGVTTSGIAFAHVPSPAGTAAVSAPIAPGAGYLVYSLASTQATEFLSMNRLSSGPYTGAPPTPVENCTGDNVSSFTLSTAWDWLCAKLTIATTGPVIMGRLNSGDGPIQAVKIDPNDEGVLAHITNNDITKPIFVQVTNTVSVSNDGTNPMPVALNSGTTALTNTGGALNVNVANGSIPVTQSGTWTLSAANPSVSGVHAASPSEATLIGVINNGTGLLDTPLLDSNGGLRVNVVGTPSSNPAASATGTTVPADASYAGLNIGGELVGQTGLSLTNAKAAAVAIVDAAGNQVGATSGSLNVNVTNPTSQQNPAAAPIGLTVPNYASYTGFNQGNDLVGVSSSNPLPVAISGTPAVTISGTVTSKNQDGAGNNLTSTAGSLNVNVTGGTTAGTQYTAGTAVATPTGTVALGTDGTDVRALSTTSTGALNVVAAPVAITGANGASVEAAQNTAAPAHVLQIGGVYNSSAPSITTGDITALQTDSVGSLKVSLAGSTVTPTVNVQSSGTNLTNTSGALNVNLQSSGTTLTNTSGALNVNVTNPASGSNSAASATGAAVPTQASYTGVVTNGTLTGLMGFTDQGAAGGAATQNGVMSMSLQQTGGNYSWAARCDSNGSRIGTNAPSTFAVCALSSKFINASGAAVSVKASSGNLYGFTLTNTTAAPAYVEFFDGASAPTLGTSTVVFCVTIPASGNVTLSPTALALMHFTTGIGFAATTAENGTTAAAVTGMIFYS